MRHSATRGIVGPCEIDFRILIKDEVRGISARGRDDNASWRRPHFWAMSGNARNRIPLRGLTRWAPCGRDIRTYPPRRGEIETPYILTLADTLDGIIEPDASP